MSIISKHAKRRIRISENLLYKYTKKAATTAMKIIKPTLMIHKIYLIAYRKRMRTIKEKTKATKHDNKTISKSSMLMSKAM